jgi:hypothetical protein
MTVCETCLGLCAMRLYKVTGCTVKHHTAVMSHFFGKVQHEKYPVQALMAGTTRGNLCTASVVAQSVGLALVVVVVVCVCVWGGGMRILHGPGLDDVRVVCGGNLPMSHFATYVPHMCGNTVQQ